MRSASTIPLSAPISPTVREVLRSPLARVWLPVLAAAGAVAALDRRSDAGDLAYFVHQGERLLSAAPEGVVAVGLGLPVPCPPLARCRVIVPSPRYPMLDVTPLAWLVPNPWLRIAVSASATSLSELN